MRAVDFLLETLSHFIRLETSPPPGVPAHAGDDFEKELAAVCQAQHLAAITLDSFEKLSLTQRLSRVSLERLRVMAKSDTEHARYMIELGSALRESFAAAGIPCLFIGGLAAAVSWYPSPAFRHIDTIELLVREEDWESITALLEERGFIPPPGARSLSGSGTVLDFYQHVTPCVFRNARAGSVTLRFRMGVFGPPSAEEPAWRRPEKVNAVPPLEVPALEDRLIKCVLDWNRSGMTNLLMLVDIGLLLGRRRNDIDWEYVTGSLGESGFYTPFCLSLEYALGLMKMQPVRTLPARPGAVRRKIFQMIWYPGADAYIGTGERQNPLRFFLLECGRMDRRLQVLKRLGAPDARWIAVLFNRAATPWQKIRLMFLLLGGKLWSRRW